jgi:hypothetical protein
MVRDLACRADEVATTAVVVHDGRDLDGHHSAPVAAAPVDLERDGAHLARGAGESPHVTHERVWWQDEPEIADGNLAVVEEASIRVVGVYEMEGVVAVDGDDERGVRKEVEQLRAVEIEALSCLLPT